MRQWKKFENRSIIGKYNNIWTKPCGLLFWTTLSSYVTLSEKSSWSTLSSTHAQCAYCIQSIADWDNNGKKCSIRGASAYIPSLQHVDLDLPVEIHSSLLDYWTTKDKRLSIARECLMAIRRNAITVAIELKTFLFTINIMNTIRYDTIGEFNVDSKAECNTVISLP